MHTWNITQSVVKADTSLYGLTDIQGAMGNDPSTGNTISTTNNHPHTIQRRAMKCLPHPLRYPSAPLLGDQTTVQVAAAKTFQQISLVSAVLKQTMMRQYDSDLQDKNRDVTLCHQQAYSGAGLFRDRSRVLGQYWCLTVEGRRWDQGRGTW